MALRKIRLGELIDLCDETNENELYSVEFVKGISTQKKFIETKANMDGVPLKGYKIVRPGCFAYVPDTSRRGDKISLAYNNTNDVILVSSISVVFKVSSDQLSSNYLFMYFNRPEFDRYSRYNSFGSAREPFNWFDMCDIEIELPDLPTQEKFVKVYLSMLENQKSYERGLDDLKLVCDAYIEDLRRKMPCEKIGSHLSIRNEQNINSKFKNDDVLGVSQEKKIMPTKSDTKDNDISKFTIIHPNDFVYNPRNGIAVGLNKVDAIISWNNTAFYINDKTLIPEYLMMWFSRKEWNRKVKIDSWGSSTEVYSFEELGNTMIPFPPVDVQKSIVDIYNCYVTRKQINEQLKEQIKNICPILIKGSIEEAKEA